MEQVARSLGSFGVGERAEKKRKGAEINVLVCAVYGPCHKMSAKALGTKFNRWKIPQTCILLYNKFHA